ncbi:hypothetical protein [Nostoc sp. UIC 10630]|uniref:hypothetical protein n=1 Tax=Nostoc sp. UIC 10630 TaxID=2100146 RepID=UPI0013D29A68|nr:hypothetical protein [Nostoc sp. UIC 10630]NEU84060.1 hypothetical protein [Nostoc sp. UIC 10630]
MATLCFKSDDYDELSGVATFSIPRFPYSTHHHQQPRSVGDQGKSSKVKTLLGQTLVMQISEGRILLGLMTVRLTAKTKSNDSND